MKTTKYPKVKKYILDLLKEKEGEITYNLGIIAIIITDGDSPLLEPLSTIITLPDDICIHINYKSVNRKMSLMIAPEDNVIDIFNSPITVKVGGPDINKLLENAAIKITMGMSTHIANMIADSLE